MKLSSPSPAAGFKAKFCVAGWTAIGLAVRGGLRSTLDMLRWKSFPDISTSNALIVGAEQLVATGFETVLVATVHSGDL